MSEKLSGVPLIHFDFSLLIYFIYVLTNSFMCNFIYISTVTPVFMLTYATNTVVGQWDSTEEIRTRGIPGSVTNGGLRVYKVREIC
jgi:hypothetical protein